MSVPDMGFIVERSLKQIIMQLITPMTFMPLLHQWTDFARQVIVAALRVHSWVILVINFALY